MIMLVLGLVLVLMTGLRQVIGLLLEKLERG